MNFMKTKACRFCGVEIRELDFPAQFDRMVTCGKTECMRLRRWERIGRIHPTRSFDGINEEISLHRL